MTMTIELTQLEANTIARALDFYLLYPQPHINVPQKRQYINLIKKLREQ